MPKMRTRAKGASRTSAIVIRNKFRIGNRKSGKSANSMSNDDLLAVLANKDKAKFHQNAYSVLATRDALPA